MMNMKLMNKRMNYIFCALGIASLIANILSGNYPMAIMVVFALLIIVISMYLDDN